MANSVEKQLGAAGESLAGSFLRSHGYRILANNYTCPLGEIDLIAFRDGTIVFVEVKTRADAADADPESNITPAKQRRMFRAAQHWLAASGQPECAYRFDAVSVILPPRGSPVIRHIVEAFLPVA